MRSVITAGAVADPRQTSVLRLRNLLVAFGAAALLASVMIPTLGSPAGRLPAVAAPVRNATGAAKSAGLTASASCSPYGIAAGPDGALWFTNEGDNSIGRITTSGVISSYTGNGIDGPELITLGPDGALWFTNFNGSSIGRITTSGVVSNYIGTGISEPLDITLGPDGALWFTNWGNSSIGRITTGGVVSNYTGGGRTHPATSHPDQTGISGSRTTTVTRSVASPPAERSPASPWTQTATRRASPR